MKRLPCFLLIFTAFLFVGADRKDEQSGPSFKGQFIGFGDPTVVDGHSQVIANTPANGASHVLDHLHYRSP